MKARAIFTGEEIEAEFEASAERDDYGVPGSPSWWEYTDAKLISFTIFDAEVLDHLPPDVVDLITNELEGELDFGEPE